MGDALSYIGHSTLLLELGDARVLTDPVLGPGIGHIRRRAPMPRLEDLASLDAVSDLARSSRPPRSSVAATGCARIAR